MNFNLYLDDQTGEQLNRAAEQSGQSRNAMIRQAVMEWLARRKQPQWPAEVMDFQGLPDLPPFEAGRDTLKPPATDPLA